jgi:hypothetical protein
MACTPRAIFESLLPQVPGVGLSFTSSLKEFAHFGPENCRDVACCRSLRGCTGRIDISLHIERFLDGEIDDHGIRSSGIRHAISTAVAV